MIKFGAFALITMLSILVHPLVAADAENDWRLMSRHGGCVSMQKAAERKPIFDRIKDPEGFIERLKQQGVAYEAKIEMIDGYRTFAIRAPSLSLSVFFVPLKFCDR